MALTPEDQDRMVSELETTLERLQALYNQYFMGIEKLEPTVVRKEVDRKIQLLRKEKIRNTAVRFRFQTQLQKYNTQSNYWRRICRQIEEGTYQRDVMRAKRRTEQRDEMAMAARALEELGGEGARRQQGFDASAEFGMDLDDPFADAARSQKPTEPPPPRLDPDKTPVPIVGTGIHDLHEKLIDQARAGDVEDLSSFFQRKSIPPPPPPRPGTPPPPRPSARPLPRTSVQPEPAARPAARPEAPPKPADAAPAPKKAAPAITEERMKSIYRAYVTARRKTNEPTDNISFDKVSKILQKQLAEKSGVKDFKVVIKEGKAVIKTVKE